VGSIPSTPWDWIFLAAEVVLVGSAIGFAVARRRSPGGTLAWIFGIVAFPIVGALAYFALANPYVRRPRRRKRAANKAVRARNPAPEHPTPPVTPTVRGLLRAASRLTDLRPTSGNRVTLYGHGHAAFAAMETAIRAAKKTIWAEYYTVMNDGTGHRFLSLLTERAREGVDVRLLVDAVGTGSMGDGVDALREAGGRIATFLPVNPLRRRWAVHLRNHRKVLVVDGAVGFVGGMNVGDPYAGAQSVDERPWRDAHLRVEGPAARDLAQVFDEDWCFMTGDILSLLPPAETMGHAIVAVVPSGPDQQVNAAATIWFACVGMAVERCWISTPYFVPDEPAIHAMTSAALRGCDVRLLVPEVNDVVGMSFVNRSFFPRLVSAGVRVWLYQPGMLHAKTLLVDDEICLVGSANVDVRSFRLNFEAGALVADRAVADTLEAGYRADLERSREVTREHLRERRPWVALAEGAAQLLSPFL
jgi:cardiolipin synthase A/B